MLAINLNVAFIFFQLYFYVICDTEMSITVDPGKDMCFYQKMEGGSVFEIDYQVIDGGQGDLDISFFFRTPDGVPIIMDYKKSEDSHRIDVPKTGDYMFCFDNRFSTFNRKTVFFALIDSSEDSLENIETASEEQYDISIQKIEESLRKVRADLVKIRHMQEMSRIFEARDRNIAESNYTTVNNWSIIQIFVMLIVGSTQVIMVKSLFFENSHINRVMRKASSLGS